MKSSGFLLILTLLMMCSWIIMVLATLLFNEITLAQGSILLGIPVLSMMAISLQMEIIEKIEERGK